MQRSSGWKRFRRSTAGSIAALPWRRRCATGSCSRAARRREIFRRSMWSAKCRRSNRGEIQSTRLHNSPHVASRIRMQDIDQRDRELLGALQGEIPLVSTPFAVMGQMIDMSEKEVIKRTERLKREGLVRQLSAQFDAHALGYRSCLVAAKVSPDRIDQAAITINAHP